LGFWLPRAAALGWPCSGQPPRWAGQPDCGRDAEVRAARWSDPSQRSICAREWIGSHAANVSLSALSHTLPPQRRRQQPQSCLPLGHRQTSLRCTHTRRGWCSWNAYGRGFNESVFYETTDAMKANGMQQGEQLQLLLSVAAACCR